MARASCAASTLGLGSSSTAVMRAYCAAVSSRSVVFQKPKVQCCLKAAMLASTP
jgi:hypothetical protein